MALPRFNLDRSPAANPAPDLASVLANIQAKLPHVVVPMPKPPLTPPAEQLVSNPQPIAAESLVHCTEVTPQPNTDVQPSRRSTPVLHTRTTETGGSAFAYLYVPTTEGEKWRKASIQDRYPKLNKCLDTTRRVLLSPLARFQLFNTDPPRDCFVYCGTPESGVPDNELWSECVGMPHGEFWGDLS